MKNCQQCQNNFEISEEDLSFYDKISPSFADKKYSIPKPTLCPDCRLQRRCAWRNERELYQRKCGLTDEKIISIYSADKHFPVYSQDAYWGDKWDALDFALELELDKPFFPQFQKLVQKVPRLAVVNKQAENSDYCNYSFANKNCYLTFGNHYEEDCLYGHYSTKNKDSVDYLWLYESELCYECIYSKNCYRSVFLDHCEDCSESYFSVDLKGCKHCIFSSNLRNKEYCILNKPHTKEEYFEKLKSFNFGSYERFSEAKKFYLNDFRQRFPFRDVYQSNCENCSGGTHENCRNLENCFDCTKCEDCSYGVQMDESYDSIDNTCMGYDRCELCIESIGCNGAFRFISCDSCWHSTDLMYCNLCFNSKNCFGCISLNHQEYCILNKQYTKAEYEELVPKIIETMKRVPSTGSGRSAEWGEFFPVELSPFGYNETIASYDFPMTRDEVESNSWQWHDDTENSSNKATNYEIADSIQDVQDNITDQVFICEKTSKPYKIIPQELIFYRELGIPTPRLAPNQRHQDRIHLRNPRKLWPRNCDKCNKSIESSYAPERPEKVYCEECYLKEVY